METKRERRGRPRKSSDSIKSKSLLLRLEEAEKQTFSDAAALAGIPLTVWIRERLRHVAIRELRDAGRPIAVLKNISMD